MKFLPLLLSAILLQDRGPDFLTLKDGMVWTYVTGNVEGKVRVAGREKVGDVETWVLTTEVGGTSTEKEFLVSDANGIRMLRQSSGDRATDYNPPFVRLKLPAAKGDTWEWKGDIGKEKASVVFTNEGMEEVTVPAGKFKAWKISAAMEIGGVKHAGANWFAPGIGIVRQQSSFESGGKKHESVIELKAFEPGK